MLEGYTQTVFSKREIYSALVKHIYLLCLTNENFSTILRQYATQRAEKYEESFPGELEEFIVFWKSYKRDILRLAFNNSHLDNSLTTVDNESLTVEVPASLVRGEKLEQDIGRVAVIKVSGFTDLKRQQEETSYLIQQVFPRLVSNIEFTESP